MRTPKEHAMLNCCCSCCYLYR